MDNLSRTRDDLKPMSIEYLQALKQELETIGMKKLVLLESVEQDNKRIMMCLKNLKYVPKQVKEAQKIESQKQKER